MRILRIVVAVALLAGAAWLIFTPSGHGVVTAVTSWFGDWYAGLVTGAVVKPSSQG